MRDLQLKTKRPHLHLLLSSLTVLYIHNNPIGKSDAIIHP